MALRDKVHLKTTGQFRFLINGRHVETVAVPIDCHLSGCHGIEHVVLEVLEGLSHLCFVHVYTIHDLGCCAHFVCHLANWLGRLTSLY